MVLYVSTTGSADPVVLDDLGKRSFSHPTTDYNIGQEYTEDELKASANLQASIDAGHMIVKDEYGNVITDISSVLIPVHPANILNIYNSSLTQSFTSTITIGFDKASRKDDAFVYITDKTGTEINIGMNGWYEVSYDISLDAAAVDSHTTSKVWLEKNNAAVDGTDSHGYHSSIANGEDTMSCRVCLNLYIDDVLRIRAQRLAGGATLNTVAKGCRLYIKLIDFTTKQAEPKPIPVEIALEPKSL